MRTATSCSSPLRPSRPRSRKPCRRGSTGSTPRRASAHDRRRDRALLRPPSARAAPPARTAAADPLRAPVAPARGRGERGIAPEYRFRHGLVRGPPTDASSRRVGVSSTCAWAKHSSSSAPRLARGGTGCSPPPLRRGRRARARGRYLSRRATPPARATHRRRRSSLYRRALGFMERTGDEARARSTLLKIALTHHLAFDYAPRTRRSARRSPDLRQRLRGSNRRADHLGVARGLGPRVAPGHSSTSRRQRSSSTSSAASSPRTRPRRRARSRRALHRLRRRALVPVHASHRRPLERRRAGDGGRLRVHLRPDGRGRRGHASWLDGVSANAADEQTLELHLREPRNDFLYRSAAGALRLAAARLRARGRDWHRAIPLVGRPVRSHQPRRESLVLEAAPTWRGRAETSRGDDRAEASPTVAADRWPRRVRHPRRRNRPPVPFPTTRPSWSARRGC